MALTALLVPAGADIIAKIICAVEQSTVAHVAVDMHDTWTIAEEAMGCKARPIEQLANPAIVHYDLPLNADQEVSVRAWLRARINDRYSYESILDDGLNLVFHAKLVDADDPHYVCSSLVAQACKLAGADLFPGKDPLSVTPADWLTLANTPTAA